MLPVYEEQDLDNVVSVLSTAKGAVIKTAIITTNLVGTLCFRRFDNAYSKQSEVLSKELKTRLPNRIEYQERQHYRKIRTKSMAIDLSGND